MPKSKKSDSQRIKEQREKLARMEARAAEKEALANPALKPLLDLIEGQKNARLAVSRKFSGPQSFQNRIAKHEAWVREIECARELASAQVENYDNKLEALSVTLTLAVNGDVTIENAIRNAAEVCEEPVEAEELTRQYEAAKAERQALTSKKEKEAEAS
jgi:hypothetical protein